MIDGRCVSIGPILPVDVPSLFGWSDDEGAARLNAVYRPPNWQHEEAFWTNAAGDRSRLFFAIRRRGDAAIIGFVQITGIDAVHRSANIGIRIGDEIERRQGHGRDALELSIRYCWNWLNLSRLALSVFAHNEPAIGLYRSLGFEDEGLLRNALFVDGCWIDVRLMALNKSDRTPVSRPPITGRHDASTPRRPRADPQSRSMSRSASFLI